MTKRIEKYWKTTIKQFLKSFRLDKRFLLSIFYDSCLVMIFFIMLNILRKITDLELAQSGFSNPAMLSNPMFISQNLAAIKSFMFSFVVAAIVFLILIILVYTIFRGMIWLTILRKKVTFSYFKKLFVLNLIWIIAWILLMLLLVIIVQKEYYLFVFLIFPILYVHLTKILHYSFTRKNDVKKSFATAFSIGLGKIKYFIFPYILVAIATLVYYNVTAWLMMKLLPATGFFYASAILVIVYFAWLRIYISNLLNKIYK